MMSYKIEDYKKAFEKFKIAQPLIWPRYNRPGAEDVLLCRLVLEQQPVSMTTIELGIRNLVSQNLLFRTDSKTFDDDKQAALDQIIARVDGPDLTPTELETFGSISHQDLMERYWQDGGVNEFAVRYRKASRLFGFQIPGRPAAQDTVAAGDEVELTAEAYNSMSARDLRVKLRDPRFKAGVYRLLADRKIA